MCSLSSFTASRLLDRVSCAERCEESHNLAYRSALNSKMEGPLMPINNNEHKFSTRREVRRSVQMRFIWLSPLSHSAVLIKKVNTSPCSLLSAGEDDVPPLSTNSRNAGIMSKASNRKRKHSRRISSSPNRVGSGFGHSSLTSTLYALMTFSCHPLALPRLVVAQTTKTNNRGTQTALRTSIE